MGYQQTCRFRKPLQWCHFTCCVQFWRIIYKGCGHFCCPWWYFQGIVGEDRLGFGSCFTWSGFELHLQVWEMYEAMCCVETTPLFLIECNPMTGPFNFFITKKCSAQMLFPVSKLGVAVACDFSNWSIATCIWKLGASSIFKILIAVSCFIVPNTFWAIALT